MLFILNGQQASSALKANTLCKGFELQDLLDTKNNQNLLKFLFNGGVVRHTSLKKGQVVHLDFGDLQGH